MRKNAEECERMWKEGRGRMRKDEDSVGCGRMQEDAGGCGRMRRDALSDLAAVMQCHSGRFSNCRSGYDWSDLWSDFI